MKEVILIDHLKKNYKAKKAVVDVSFAVMQGEVFGIVGPNGAGKTTTLEIIEGLRQRDGGNVTVLGMDPGRQKRQLHQHIGVQFQLTALQDRLKVNEALKTFASLYAKKIDIAATIDFFGLRPYLFTTMHNLSGGWRQRVSLALAVLHDPSIIFLDEPTTGLDPAARQDVWKLIESLKAKGKTIVLTTHYMEEAERLCDRIAMFKQGEIAYIDHPAKLLQQFSAHPYLKIRCASLLKDWLIPMKDITHIHEMPHGEWHLEGNDLPAITLEILQRCAKEGIKVDHLEFVTGRLDDLFTHLVNQEESSTMLGGR